MVTSECLAEDTILAFAEGRLDAPAVSVLEAHARSCPSCTELLAATLGVVHGASPRPPATPGDAPITRGTAIGRYLVLAAVGRGGMGEVFAAYDPELDRKVALKLLHTEAGTSVARGRLLREAKAIARLSHPNVVVVHDAGTFDDRVFVAMEFVEGQTVAAWLAERPRDQREILDVFLAAARGLGAAHAAGLVHRDFKPQNVMVTGTGAVRVMDFGLARAIGDDAAAVDPAPALAAPAPDSPARWDVTLTQTGELLGTPLYMAPEQFQARRTDAQTDQFSFCVALYQALYGSHPFRSESFAELMADVTSGQVQAPPARSPVPAWLRRVLLRGLSVDPGARWPSMDALMAGLEHDPARARRHATWGAVALAALIAGGFGVSRAARRPVSLCQAGASRIAGAWEQAPEGPRRQKVRGAFLATDLGYAAETWERVAARLDDYAGRWLAMYRDSCEATQLRGEQSAEVLDLRTSCLDERLTRLRALVDVLAAADRDTVSNAVDAASGLPALDRCADIKQLRSPVEPPAAGETTRRVDDLRTRAATVDAYNLTGKHQQALALSRALVTEARALGYRPLLAELLERRWASNTLADSREPNADLEEAFSLALATRRDEVAAEAAALLTGIVGYYQAQHQQGERWAALADALFERLGPGHDVGRAWVQQNRADMRMQANDLDAALVHQREALALKRRAFPNGSGDLAISLNTEGEILFRKGDPAAALERNGEAGEMLRRVYGARSPALAINLSNRGEYLVALGRAREALAPFQDALARWESTLGPRHVFLGYPLTGIGVAHWKLGRADEAIPPLERALAIRAASEPDLTQLAETRFALARALWDAGRDRARARQLATAARADFERPAGQGTSQGTSQETSQETSQDTGQALAHTQKAREVTDWLAAHGQVDI